MARIMKGMVLLIMVIALAGCSGEEDSETLYTSLDEMKAPGTVLGVMTGTIFDGISSSTFTQAELEYYNSYADMAYLVSQGQLAGYLTDEPLARYTQLSFPSVTYIEESLGEANYAFAFAKTDMGTKLMNEMNQFLAKIRQDGTLDEIDSIWFGGDESLKVIDKSGLTGENGTIRVGTSVECAPFTYMVNGEVAGYEIDILYRFCREYGYIPEINTTDLTSLIPGLLNRYDMGASCITITEERKESIQFSDPDYYGGIVMVVKGEGAEESFWDSLKDSFEKTFIREDRWQMILQGLWVTIWISIMATLLGTILGFGLCLMKLSGSRAARAVVQVYVRVLQGTPIVVLLMILFYIVFAGTSIGGTWVGIIGFGLNFAASFCQMMHTGIKSVDKGQNEAALAIGFTRSQAFLKVVLPQAARQFLPMYKGEFVSLIKMTSVVGYIAIQDLTKMSDIIRSRTYDAFFPLITTAVIYFIISWLMSFAVSAIEVKVEPDRKNRRVKGVVTK